MDDQCFAENNVRTRVVLGIDAAWTLGQPSGVALAVNRGRGWKLVEVSPSYLHFTARARGESENIGKPAGSRISAVELIASSERLCGAHVDLVAIDMPLSLDPITTRRPADNKVSAAYGGRKCGTHTPSVERPGPISDALLRDFHHAGYGLQTLSIASPGLIEVYPHPALVELFSANERLPYKFAKLRKYWPNFTVAERRARVRAQWREIVSRLELKITGVVDALPEPSEDTATVALKAYEDMIDAVVCAWVAVCALEGKATPFGDERSAIWIPAVGD